MKDEDKFDLEDPKNLAPLRVKEMSLNKIILNHTFNAFL